MFPLSIGISNSYYWILHSSADVAGGDGDRTLVYINGACELASKEFKI